ncbi:MAG: hypothetical protein BWK72_18365 [Rhodoferax ferrireducens]|uniref:Uncharacterized protein n=1 Tax=Rhodoferax ferrireducens TaxID=192843 RepID=A0A1W9KPY4_9BURK|nr:MAG: hypothetical protein BWK72_18365 [Rhodoferax ferrireducens]
MTPCTIPKSQNHLAQLLGVSPALMTKHKRMGMPTDTLEAARAWRENNLHPLMTKDSPMRAPLPSQTDDRLADARGWLDLASEMLQAGLALGSDLEAKTRASLRAVPAQHRAVLLLPIDVMDVLCGPVLALVTPTDRTARCDDGSPAFDDHLSDDDAAWLGSFWYGVAAGEIRVT